MMLIMFAGISSVMITGLFSSNEAPINRRRLGCCTLAAMFVSLRNRSMLCREMITTCISLAPTLTQRNTPYPLTPRGFPSIIFISSRSIFHDDFKYSEFSEILCFRLLLRQCKFFISPCSPLICYSSLLFCSNGSFFSLLMN